MTERWQAELTKLRDAQLPTDLWDRVGEGPRLEPLGPPPRSRVAAGVVAIAVFAVAAVLVWRVFAPAGTGDQALPGADLLEVPPRGEVAPVFLADGRPVFVVHHVDGAVSVVDAFSSHVQYGLKDVVAWCPSTREFVEVAHEARFDEFGDWRSAGPAPAGLATFAFDVVERDANGDPTSIQIGAIREPSPGGSAPTTDPSTYPEFCAGPSDPAPGTPTVRSGTTDQVGTVVAHGVDEADVWPSPAAAVAAAPDGWIAVRGRLLVSPDGFVELCADVEGDRCIDGASVRGVDGVGLLVNVIVPHPEWYGVEPQTWIARVEDGLLRDVGGIWFFTDIDVPRPTPSESSRRLEVYEAMIRHLADPDGSQPIFVLSELCMQLMEPEMTCPDDLTASEQRELEARLSDLGDVEFRPHGNPGVPPDEEFQEVLLGPIVERPDGLRVEGGVVCGGLCGSGAVYILVPTEEGYEVTGTDDSYGSWIA
jgi:hypothetical protein